MRVSSVCFWNKDESEVEEKKERPPLYIIGLFRCCLCGSTWVSCWLFRMCTLIDNYSSFSVILSCSALSRHVEFLRSVYHASEATPAISILSRGNVKWGSILKQIYPISYVKWRWNVFGCKESLHLESMFFSTTCCSFFILLGMFNLCALWRLSSTRITTSLQPSHVPSWFFSMIGLVSCPFIEWWLFSHALLQDWPLFRLV